MMTEERQCQPYLGAMRAAINRALANRQILTHLTRQVFAQVLPGGAVETLYDVSHNTCQVERHQVNGDVRDMYVHRKGATRAFGPGHPDLPARYRAVGQPVIIGGSMGTGSYVWSIHGRGIMDPPLPPTAPEQVAASWAVTVRQSPGSRPACGRMTPDRSHPAATGVPPCPAAHDDCSSGAPAGDETGLTRGNE